MHCPICQSKTETTDTRNYEDPNGKFDYVERKRRCLDEDCLHAFKTIEVSVETWGEMTE
jgi:transcriptional regulator NrdR family protein